MREGLRSSEKVRLYSLDDRGLAKEDGVVGNLKFDVEKEQCSQSSSKVDKQAGKGKRGRKRKNAEIAKEADCESGAVKEGNLNDVQDGGDKGVAEVVVTVGGNGDDVSTDAPLKEAKEGELVTDEKKEDTNLDEGDGVLATGAMMADDHFDVGASVDAPLKEADEGDYSCDEKEVDTLKKIGDRVKVEAGLEMMVDANNGADVGVDTPIKEADKTNHDDGEKIIAGVEMSVDVIVDAPLEEADSGNCESDEKEDATLKNLNDDNKVATGEVSANANANGNDDLTKDTLPEEADEGVCKSNEKRDASLMDRDDGDKAIASAELYVNATADELPKRRRGRKRKSERAECISDGDVSKIVKDGVGSGSRRVLRSRSDASKENVDTKEEEPLACDRPKMSSDLRGRPCKLKEKTEVFVHDKTDTDEDKKPRRGRPKKFKRRGRPAKVKVNDDAPGKQDGGKRKDIKPQGISKPEKVEGQGTLPIVHREIGELELDPGMQNERTNSQSKIKEKKTETMGLREEKQEVRDRIISMLQKAGWTIEYRARQNKDYADAVYVDCEGKTYWSATLAYRKLKEKVDSIGLDGDTLTID